MTSTTAQRSWDCMVSRSLSMHSTAVLAAVSKPMVYSVQTMSLSMVPGMPTTDTPHLLSSWAPRKVPSPPMATMPSSPSSLQVLAAFFCPSGVRNSSLRAV